MSVPTVVHNSSEAFQLKSNSGFSGYSSAFQTHDLQGDIIDTGAFVGEIP